MIARTFASLSLFLFFTGLSSLNAAPETSADKPSSWNTLGLQLQFWTGMNRDFYQTDLETRFFRDDLLRGQSSTAQPVAAAQWTNRWVNKPQFNLPLRAYFSPSFLPQLYIDASYYRVRGAVTYYGVSDLPLPERTHIVELGGYDRSTTQVGAAYNFLGFFQNDAVTLLALRGGFIRESLNFNYKPMSFASTGIAVAIFDNPFHAQAQGLYGGIELTLPVLERWSVTARVDRSESLRGNMTQERIQFQPATTGAQATYERAEASYRLQRTDRLVALNYHVSVDFKVTMGYREVIYDVSYPGYLSYSLTNTGGALQIFPASEMALDYFIYQETRRERLGNVVVAFEKIFYL